MEQGWVYVLVNSSIPGMVKVGRTTRAPASRVAELSGATGVATPFVLAFDQHFANCMAAEAAIHKELDRRGLRVAPNREFFRANPAEVVRIILELASLTGSTPREAAMGCAPGVSDLLAEGDRHLIGAGNTLQDLAEASRCYRLAATRGSLVAYERLGVLALRTRGHTRTGRKRVLQYLKHAARCGNYYAYTEMAKLFAEEYNTPNFLKAWDLFFTTRAAAPLEEVELGANRYGIALRRYVMLSRSLTLELAHLPELRVNAEALINALATALDQVRDAPELRADLADTLAWCYATLLPPPRTGTASPLARWGGLWMTAGRRVVA